MAKISNLNVIQAAVIDVYNAIGCSLDEYLEQEEVYDCITMIYVNGDRTAGFGQDYADRISVISSPERVSIIGEGAMSFYKNDGPICQYNDLVDDINQIIIVIDAAIARWRNGLA